MFGYRSPPSGLMYWEFFVSMSNSPGRLINREWLQGVTVYSNERTYMPTEIATSRHLQYDHEVRWNKQQGVVALRETITCCAHRMSAKEVQKALQEDGKSHRYYVVRSESFEASKKHHPLSAPTQHVVYGALFTFVRPYTPLPRRSKPVQTEETGGPTSIRYKLQPYVHVLDNRTGRLSRVARQRLRELVTFDELASLLEEPSNERP